MLSSRIAAGRGESSQSALREMKAGFQYLPGWWKPAFITMSWFARKVRLAISGRSSGFAERVFPGSPSGPLAAHRLVTLRARLVTRRLTWVNDELLDSI
jgi:hypothetical protein